MLAALTDTLGFWDQEEHKHGKTDIHRHEEKQALEALVVEEDGEELREDRVGDILHLRTHTNRLGTNIDREDLGSPDPDSGTP